MSINKYGSSQQMRDRANVDIYLEEDVPEFTPEELEVMEKLNQLCVEKGIDQDVFIEKLLKYRR
ncbi:MAG: hypothetical protein QXO69_03690 [archaeon]